MRSINALDLLFSVLRSVLIAQTRSMRRVYRVGHMYRRSYSVFPSSNKMRNYAITRFFPQARQMTTEALLCKALPFVRPTCLPGFHKTPALISLERSCAIQPNWTKPSPHYGQYLPKLSMQNLMLYRSTHVPSFDEGIRYAQAFDVC